jgi:hypothetical protein
MSGFFALVESSQFGWFLYRNAIDGGNDREFGQTIDVQIVFVPTGSAGKGAIAHPIRLLGKGTNPNGANHSHSARWQNDHRPYA